MQVRLHSDDSVDSPSAPRRRIKPRALRAGDLVVAVAPAAAYDDADLSRGLAILRSWGLQVEAPIPAAPLRYLAATDAERARRLTDALARPDAAAVVAVRGGYGLARLWKLVDLAPWKTHPKIVVGYSDLSLLLARLIGEADAVAWHGPMVASDLPFMAATDLERLRAILFGESAGWEVGGLAPLAPGCAEGTLVGGCLSSLVTTLGTPYEIDTRGAVVFLEDVGEKAFRLDRMLTHLAHAGKLAEASAVVLGRFHRCAEGEAPTVVHDLVTEIVAPYGVPILAGMDAGHGSGHLPLPMGCRVRVDSGAGTLLALESPFAGP